MDTVRNSKANNWGASIGVRLPADFTRAADIRNNSDIKIILEGNRIIIEKLEEKPKRRNIQTLFAEYPEDFVQEQELDWGNPVGDEIW